jgi:hypothetical protein
LSCLIERFVLETIDESDHRYISCATARAGVHEN